jgi:hypothetical protein
MFVIWVYKNNIGFGASHFISEAARVRKVSKPKFWIGIVQIRMINFTANIQLIDLEFFHLLGQTGETEETAP